MSYEIVKYHPAYNDQICDLEKANWSSDLSVNKSYLQWKYFENPYSDQPKLYLVLHDEELVAVRGAYETIWQLGDGREKFKAPCMSDLVIRPDFRNKGIYPQLMNHVIKDLHDLGYQYLLNFSAGSINYVGSLAMGWKSIGNIEVLTNKAYQQHSITNLLRNNRVMRFLRATGITRLRKIAADRMKRNMYQIPKNTPRQLSVCASPKPAEMTVLVNKQTKKNKISISRDVDFFKWRYKNPLSEYIFLYWHDPSLKGYLVAQTRLYRDSSKNIYNLLELEGENPVVRIELLRSFITLLGSRTMTVWSITLDQPCINYLISNGFRAASSKRSKSLNFPSVIIKSTNYSGDKIEYKGVDLLDINNWDLKTTCSDSY